jgi:hypothetical protein
MLTTRLRCQKDTECDEGTNCYNDWCEGPGSDTLPCFTCFDSDREYDVEAGK